MCLSHSPFPSFPLPPSHLSLLPSVPHLTPMLITISRQYGAGGSEVARRVAAALEWRVVDNELIEQVAARAGPPDRAGGRARRALSHLRRAAGPHPRRGHARSLSAGRLHQHPRRSPRSRARPHHRDRGPRGGGPGTGGAGGPGRAGGARAAGGRAAREARGSPRLAHRGGRRPARRVARRRPRRSWTTPTRCGPGTAASTIGGTGTIRCTSTWCSTRRRWGWTGRRRRWWGGRGCWGGPSETPPTVTLSAEGAMT